MNNKIKLLCGNCLEILPEIDRESIDLIFADPPYNLSNKKFLTVKSGKPVRCDKGEWDEIGNIHEFNLNWIKKCIEVLKPQGTLWVSGTLHNYPSIGMALKELNMWIINDIVWFKRNAPPILSRNRLAPSTEIIWLASKNKKYFFNYELAKEMNNGKQMRNLWEITAKRHKTSHPTEKPEDLLERIVLLGSKEGDLILDPFMGSGTTGVVSKRLNRNFIGIELNQEYFEIAKNRIESTYQDNSLLNYLESDAKEISESKY